MQEQVQLLQAIRLLREEHAALTKEYVEKMSTVKELREEEEGLERSVADLRAQAQAAQAAVAHQENQTQDVTVAE